MKAEHKCITRSIYSGETMAQFFQRISKGGGRKPLRSLKELAEELGISTQSLKMKMQLDENGPRPRYATGGSSTPRNTWFDPDEVRKWWKARKT